MTRKNKDAASVNRLDALTGDAKIDLRKIEVVRSSPEFWRRFEKVKRWMRGLE